MKFSIPLPLRHEHEAFHEPLHLATQAGGEVGAAAKMLAQLVHPRFIKEDQFALPPLGCSGRQRLGLRVAAAA